ncbi:MAG: rhodanese-related sulfurtransferase [Candidatus Promineifilaceae bacterium]
MNSVVIVTFYKFVELADYQDMQQGIGRFCRAWQVQGTILLASEGINATIAGTRAGIDAVLAHLRSDLRLVDLTTKESYADKMPFIRMKVRIKKEIVTLRQEVDPRNTVGQYIKPHNWNSLISDPEVKLIDTRNDFEVQIGSFQGAINPRTTSFTEFVDYVRDNLDPARDKKVAMFCTGGIRCEKATSYLLQQGFEDVYHLEGGILKYLEEVPQTASMWDGECFVFDNRVTVDHDLKPGSYQLCHGCWHPLDSADIDNSQYEPGVCCPYCVEGLTDNQLKNRRERVKQIELAKARGEAHIGRVSAK